MEVLEIGTVPPAENWTSSVICGKNFIEDNQGCGAKLKISSEDISVYHYFGTNYQHKYPAVRCKLCGKIIAVKDVPPPLLEKIVATKKSIFDGYDGRG